MEDEVLHVDDPAYMAQYMRRAFEALRPIQPPKKPSDKAFAALLAEIERKNDKSNCQHTVTGMLIVPDVELENGTLIDGEQERICLDCRKVLEVVG